MTNEMRTGKSLAAEKTALFRLAQIFVPEALPLVQAEGG